MINRGLAAAILFVGLWAVQAKSVAEWRFDPAPKAKLGTGAVFETVFEHKSSAGTAHAPAIAHTRNGPQVIWFDGTRESARDVKILSANLPNGEVDDLFTTRTVSQKFTPQQTILILGNAIADTARDAYFATVVTMGGWAAASVSHVTVDHARKLNLSPILARSHLVKSPAIRMRNGAVLLPSYFEMADGYGVAALLNERRRVVGQSKMSGAFAGIQPVIMPLSEISAVALLRRFDDQNDRLLASWTNDGGQSWSPPAPTDIPNPNAPVAAVTLENGDLLMLYNDQADRADTLRFAVSSDGGKNWSEGRILDGPGRGDLRYPMMEVMPDGMILATYSTHGKKGIVAHRFSADWAVAQ